MDTNGNLNGGTEGGRAVPPRFRPHMERASVSPSGNQTLRTRREPERSLSLALHLHPSSGQEKTLHMDITRWTIPKSDWFYSLQLKMEKFYTVIKNMKRVTSPGLMHDTGCLGLVHWDNPEGWYGEGGGRREEGSGWGTHVYLWRIHFDIWQNQYNIVNLKIKLN